MQATATELAMTFLCKRNPFPETGHSDYVFALMKFQDVQGDKALEALAGYYIWRLLKANRPNAIRDIRVTFAHDLNDGVNTECCDPRSNSYHKFWLEEIATWQDVTIIQPNTINNGKENP